MRRQAEFGVAQGGTSAPPEATEKTKEFELVAVIPPTLSRVRATRLDDSADDIAGFFYLCVNYSA